MSRTVSQKWLASNHGVQRRLLEAEQRGLHGYCEDGGRVASVRPSVCCPNDDKKQRKEGENKREETRTSFSRIIIIILIERAEGAAVVLVRLAAKTGCAIAIAAKRIRIMEGAGRDLGGVEEK